MRHLSGRLEFETFRTLEVKNLKNLSALFEPCNDIWFRGPEPWRLLLLSLLMALHRGIQKFSEASESKP